MKRFNAGALALIAIAAMTWPASAAADAPVFTAQPPALSASSAAHFEFSYPGAISYTCALDGAAGAACTSPFDLTGLVDGAHSFTVTASYMGMGQTCVPMPPGPDLCFPTPVVSTSDVAGAAFTIDTTAPVVTIVSGPKNRSARKSTNATFAFMSSEHAVTFSCKLDTVLIAPCASPLRLKKLRVGLHRLEVQARDAVGNSSAVHTRLFAVNTKRTTYKFVKGNKIKRCTRSKRGVRCKTRKLK